MANVDITALSIMVESRGIAEAATNLEALSKAAANVETKTSSLTGAFGGLSASQAAQVANIEKLLQKQQKQADLYGATASQVNVYNLAEKGANDIQKLRGDILGRALEAQKAQTAAEKEAISVKQKMNTLEVAAAKEAEDFVRSLKHQADQVGMTHKEIKEYNAELLRTKAAQLGVTTQVEGHIQTLKNAKGPHENFNLLTAGSTRELLVLGHELSQGSFQRFGGSLIVLAERVNFLPSLLEKAGTAAASLGVSLGVLIAAVAAIVAVIAVATLTFVHSSTALHEMRDAVILTGGSAGATGSQFYDMANKIGTATGKFSEARKAVLELANTGRFTADQIDLIAQSAVDMERFAGVSVEHTVKMFEKLAAEPLKATAKGFHGVSDAALELNKSMHFLDPEILSQILHLEETGRGAEASKLAISHLAEEQKKRTQELRENLTVMGKLSDTVGASFSRMWNNMFHKQSDSEKLGELREKLERAAKLGVNGGGYQLSETVKEFEALSAKMAKDSAVAKEKQHKVDINDAADLALIEQKGFMQRGKNEDNLANALARQQAAVDAWRKTGKESEFFTDKANAEAIANIYKKYAEKAKPEKGIGLSGLDEANKQVEMELEVKQRGFDNEMRLIEMQRKYKQINETDAANEKDALLNKEYETVTALYEKEIKNTEAFHSKDVRLMNDAMIKKFSLMEKLGKFQSDMQLRMDQNASKEIKAANESEVAAQQAYDAQSKTLEKEINALQDKHHAYEMLPAAMKKVGVTEKQMQDLVTQGAIDRLEYSKLDDTMGAAELKRVDDLIKKYKQKRDAQALVEGDDHQRTTALAEPARLKAAAAETANLWKETGSSIEKALTSAFGNAGAAAGGMFKAFADGQAQQVELAQKLSEAKKREIDSGVAETELIGQLQDKQAEARIHAYGDMAGAAKKFFKEGTTGYKVMETAEKAFRVYELAMALKSFLVKSGLLTGLLAVKVGTDGAAAASGAAYTVVEVAQAAIRATAHGIVAMAKALASAPPPFNFIAAGLTAAALVAVGVKLFGHASGGGPSSEQRQADQGAGSVLGDASAKSESITHSLSVMEKNSGLGLVQGNQMVVYLRALATGISNLAQMVVRTSGITGATAATTTGAAYNLGFNSINVNPFGGALAKVQGKILNSVFGGNTSVLDTGFTLGSKSLGSTLSGGVNASQYADTKRDGGWFRSDKYGTNLSGLGAETNDQFGKVIKSMSDTLIQASKELGIGGDAFTNHLKTFIIDIGKISLKGMSGADIQKAIESVFSKLGDDMAKFAITGLDKFQAIGEGYLETVVRVVNDMMQVKDIFMILDKSFALTGIAAINVSESLIAAAGGLDQLTSGTKYFVDNFLTEAEKMGPITNSLAARLKELGIQDVTTIDLFKKKIRALDLTNAADQQLYVAMLELAPAFKEVSDYSDKLAEGTVELTKAQKAAVDAVNKARSNLQDAYKAESSALQSTIDKTKTYIQTLKDFQNSQKLGANSPLTNQEKYAEARKQYDAVAIAAKAGDAAAQQKFTSIANEFLNASKIINASGQAYTKDFNDVQDMTGSLVDAAINQVDVATASLNALNAQVAGLIEIDKSVMSVTQAITELRLAIEAGKAAGVSNAALGVPDPVGTNTTTTSTNVLVDAINALNARVDQMDTANGVQTGALINAIVDTSESNAEAIVTGVTVKAGGTGRGDSSNNRLIQIA